MFRRTDRQTTLFGAEAWLGAGARERLRGSWAEWFRSDILPILFECEGDFADLYGERGRPNWSVARLLSVCLLQQMKDLDDQAALDALSFDARWQYALGLAPDEAYLSRRSLVGFRGRLVARDPDGERIQAVFDRVCQAGLERLELSTAHQRLDSTLITSNIRAHGRLSLARETLRVFLRALSEAAYQQVSAAIRAWHEGDEDGWERDPNGPEGRGRLHELGRWVRELVEQFASDEAVRDGEPYQLLARLLREHAAALGQDSDDDADDENDVDEPPSGPSAGNARNRRKAARRKKKAAKSKGSKARFWSPHDPDASFGHKGLGYHVHITETCRNARTELLTDYEVVTAAVSDVGRAMPVIERLRERKLAPEVLYADGGYPTPAHLVEAHDVGVELCAPVHRGRLSEQSFARSDFAWDGDGQLVACPAGHAPTRCEARASGNQRALHAFFDAETCDACPERVRCPVRQPNNARSRECRLDIRAELRARDRRWAEQQTDEWRDRYRIRAGVEGTMSELKRRHGLGRLRVRRLPRVRLQVALKATACNLKRWARARRALGAPVLVVAAVLAALARTRLNTAAITAAAA